MYSVWYCLCCNNLSQFKVSVSADGGISYESFVDMIVNGYPLASS